MARLPFPPRLDKRALALAGARFRAWWEGTAFDPVAAETAYAAALSGKPVAEGADLFADDATPPPPRLWALARVWGAGRLFPGDDHADALQPTRLDLKPDGVLAVLGPGGVAPLKALAGAHVGPIAAFEWREDAADPIAQALERAGLAGRVSVAPVDLETIALPQGAYGGLISCDEFSVCASPSRLAAQITKALAPGAHAVIEAYAGAPGPDLAPAFAAAFLEPQLRPAADLERLLEDAGLAVVESADLTEEHLTLAREGFRGLESALSELMAEPGGALQSAQAMRELAWETDAWRARVRLLHAQRLTRRQWLVMRREG